LAWRRSCGRQSIGVIDKQGDRGDLVFSAFAGQQGEIRAAWWCGSGFLTWLDQLQLQQGLVEILCGGF